MCRSGTATVSSTMGPFVGSQRLVMATSSGLLSLGVHGFLVHQGPQHDIFGVIFPFLNLKIVGFGVLGTL